MRFVFASLFVLVACSGTASNGKGAESPADTPAGSGTSGDASNAGDVTSGVVSGSDAELAGVQGKTETFPDATSLEAAMNKHKPNAQQPCAKSIPNAWS